MSRTRICAAIAAAFTLSACAGGSTWIAYNQQLTLYSPQLVEYAGQNGAVPAEIIGNPFAQPTSAEAIAANLETPGWLSARRLNALPVGQGLSTTRIVLVFNPDYYGPTGDAACTNAASLPVQPNGTETRVAADLCVGNRTISWLVATAPTVQSADDPRFQSMMSQVMANLLPPWEQVEKERSFDFPQ